MEFERFELGIAGVLVELRYNFSSGALFLLLLASLEITIAVVIGIVTV
jgi:hypothetical protein